VNFAQLLFPDFSLILIGHLLCRFTALNRQVWEPVESLVYYFLFPVLLFHSIVRTPLDLGAASSLAAAGLALAAVAIALNYSLPWWPGLGKGLDRRLHAASAQVGFRFNSFIALALAERVAGPQGLQMVAVLIGLCVPIFNVGAVWPMYRQNALQKPQAHRKGFATELLRNPLILATVTGLAANLVGISVPQWLEPTVTRIGGASLALGLMAAGAGMQLGNLAQAKRLGLALLGIRHLVMPLVAWALARLIGLSHGQTAVLLMFSALPTASTCYVLAARMGFNGAYVAGLVTLSTLLGMASLPFALGLLLNL
jgi:malonate transporter and related proteins